MLVELMVVAVGTLTLAACALGEDLARRGRRRVGALGVDPGEAPHPDLPLPDRTGPEPFEPLPLVAPGRAGYGTATRIVLRATAVLRGDPTRSRLADRPDRRGRDDNVA